MTFRSVFRNKCGRKSGARRLPGASSLRLSVESLEDRRLLSAGGNEQLTALFGFETDTAVDPNNPNIVATSQFNRVLVSADGGRTFPTTVTVNAPGGGYLNTSGGDPTLSFDSQGNVYFGYLSNQGTPANMNFTLAVFGALIDPIAGVVLQNQLIAAETNTFQHDKEWVAADHWVNSPFRDNAYMVWSRLGGGSQILFSRTTDGGATWSAPMQLDPGGQGFVWPSELTVGPNGDVWVGWHTNTANTAGNLGSIAMVRSSDGGQTFQPVTTPFPAGTADITDNAPPNPTMAGNISWMQGAVQPRILVDPVRPNNVYVISVDDPDNNYASGDPADIVMARSTDYGASWIRSTISHGPFGTIQTMPTAAIDEDGNITVTWYDSRNGAPSVGVDQILGTADDNLLLDLFATVSVDGGLTFSNDFQLNEVAFDPDLGPPTDRFPPNNVFRIGEYNGHDADSGYAYVSWTANSGNNQDIAFDVFSALSAFPDEYEENDTLATATALGSLPYVTLNGLTIDPGDSTADKDFYRIAAHRTGKLVVDLAFVDRAGNLDLEIQDAAGNQIAVANSMTDDESLVIPVVGGEDYFIHVYGVNGNTNHYDLEIENFAAPTPTAVHLNPADDTGMMNNDNVTSETRPQFLIQVDLNNFENMGIAIDPPAGNPGADVEVTLVGTNTATLITGDATRLAGPLWTFTPAAALADDVYFVSAAVKITDGQTPPVMDNGPLSPPLWVTIDATVAAAPAAADLLSSSDSGMFDDDEVTNKMQPAFAGTVAPNEKVRVFAQKVGTAVVELVGQGVANSDGTWEVTVEPLVDGAYDITVRTEDAAGLLSAPSEPLRIWIDTAVPNTPQIDLITDSGRHDTDNITLDATPTLVLTGDDTVNGDGNPFPNDVKYRLYDRPGAATGEVLLFDSFATIPGFTTNGQLSFTPATALADGVHNLKLEIEDRAGNLSPDFLLEVTVDTQTPPVQFGDATGSGLAADSDSGVASDPGTFVDLITNDATPTLYGLAEADATVRVFADLNGNGAIDAGDPLLGQTVAVPLDGNQAEPDGYWELTSVIDLNDPNLFAVRDGARPLLVWAEDLAGNTNTPSDEVGDAAQALTIFLDTVAPRIAAVQVSDNLEYDLFDPKPSENGPSPLVRSLTISIADAPFRLPAFIYDAIQADTAGIPGNYLLVGDHVGVIPIQSVEVQNVFVAGGLITASGTIRLNFFEPLPDDRFTLTISDNLSDPAGNHLDGESSADEPQEDPGFASGDGQPGGEFVARFTLDSRPEIGTYVSVGINIDINGNFDWDPSNTQIGNDATNVDLTFTLPLADATTGAVAPGGYSVHDLLVVGQFASGGGLIVGDDAVFVIDISASTTNPFEGGFVGDLNNDGLFDTILDAEIAAFIALNQELIDRGLGNESNVAIVSFSDRGGESGHEPGRTGCAADDDPSGRCRWQRHPRCGRCADRLRCGRLDEFRSRTRPGDRDDQQQCGRGRKRQCDFPVGRCTNGGRGLCRRSRGAA